MRSVIKVRDARQIWCYAWGWEALRSMQQTARTIDIPGRRAELAPGHMPGRRAELAPGRIPAAPLAFASEPHMQSGSGLVWLTSPPGVVAQMVAPFHGTLELVNWLVGPVYDALDRRAGGRNALMFVLDLGLMTGRSNASRTVLLSKARQCAKRFAEVVIVAPHAATPMQRNSLSAGISLVRILGVRVSLADSARAAVESLSLRPAAWPR